jgi:tRNA modification GTPase
MPDASLPPVDTIAAIATPAGPGGVGVVRVSGPAAAHIAQVIAGTVPTPRLATLATFRGADGAPLDRGLALYFPAPHSYTGEDVLELQGHGSPAVLALLVAACLAHGARAARPGEFTQRAFLNGKLDLTEAEAVADLINASSAAAARAAARSLTGEFSRRVHALDAQLLEVRALGEALLDFPDERDVPLDIDLRAPLDDLVDACARLRAAAHNAARITDAFHVVLAGRPNAGKSSLLNALSGEDAAIVMAQPGTTRDVLRVEVNLDGLRVLLVDTAGLRQSTEPVEQEGIRRAHAELQRADHVLYIVDASDARAREAADEEIRALPLPPGARVTKVLNKADVHYVAGQGVAASATAGIGLDAVRGALQRALGHAEDAGTAVEGSGAFSARERQVQALERAEAHITSARDAQASGLGGELVAEDLRLAHEALGEITGRVAPDDVLAQVFGRFCIGK